MVTSGQCPEGRGGSKGGGGQGALPSEENGEGAGHGMWKGGFEILT